MRVVLLILVAAGALQGCAAAGAGIAAATNASRQRAATTPADSLATARFVPGDTLTVYLSDGTDMRGAFDALAPAVQPDSLRLSGGGTFALGDITCVEQTWTRESVGEAFFLGIIVDALVLYVSLRDLNPYSGFH